MVGGGAEPGGDEQRADLDKPTSGTVAGQRIDTLGETRVARYRRNQVGMVFQFFNLPEDLTAAASLYSAGSTH